MADILMVCVRQDVARTEALAEMFRSAGVSIGNLHASDVALRSSAAAILVWSRASVQSASFRDASRRAIRAGRALIVNLIGPSSRPTRLGGSPIFDLSCWAGDPADAALHPLRNTVASRVKELREQIGHWRAIRHSDEASAFVDYLARYGLDAAFSDAAEHRLDEIAFGALVGMAPSSAQLEPTTEDSDLRSARGRRRVNAVVGDAQTDDQSRGGAVCDGSAAPTSASTKRRARQRSSRSTTSSEDVGERDFALGRLRAAASPEWSPRSSPRTERDEPTRSRVKNAAGASGGDMWTRVETAAREAAALLGLNLCKVQLWAIASFDALRIPGLASNRGKSDHASQQKTGAGPANLRASERASVKTSRPLQARRAAPGAGWSAVEHTLGDCLTVGRRVARHPIAIAPVVIGAALAGVLHWTGAAPNMTRSVADIGIENTKVGEIVYFNEPEPADHEAANASEAQAAAARSANRRKGATTPSRPARTVGVAPAISMSSNDISVSPDTASRSPLEPLRSSAALSTETLSFDLAPDLAEPARSWPVDASSETALRTANPVGTAPLGGAAIALREASRCTATVSQADTELQEPVARDKGVPHCVER